SNEMGRRKAKQMSWHFLRIRTLKQFSRMRRDQPPLGACVLPHFRFLVGSTHSIMGFSKGAFRFPLHLLSNALDPERRIAGYSARFSFDAPYDFVDLAVH